MPTLEGEEFKPAVPSLPDDQKVFPCKETGEAFKSYDDFLSRKFQLLAHRWACSYTGKANLSFAEALEAEQEHREQVESIPSWLEAVVCQEAHHRTAKTFHALCTSVFRELKDSFRVGFEVEVGSGRKKQRGTIIDSNSQGVLSSLSGELVDNNSPSNLAAFSSPVDLAKLAASKAKAPFTPTSGKNGNGGSLAKGRASSKAATVFTVEIDSTGETKTVKATDLRHIRSLMTLKNIKALLTDLASRVFPKCDVWAIKQSARKKHHVKNKLSPTDIELLRPSAVATPKKTKQKSRQPKPTAEEDKATAVLELMKDMSCKKKSATLRKQLQSCIKDMKKREQKKYLKEFDRLDVLRTQKFAELKEETIRRKKEAKEKEKEKKQAEREYWRPREDLTLDDSTPMPNLPAFKTKLSQEAFLRALTVSETALAFAEALEKEDHFDYSFTLRDLEQSLSLSHVNDLVTDLALLFLDCLLGDDNTKPADISVLGLPLEELAVDCHSVSGLLLWYLTASAAADFNQPAVIDHLKTNTFFSLSVGLKLDVLEFLALRVLDTERIRDAVREAMEKASELSKQWHKEKLRFSANIKDARKALQGARQELETELKEKPVKRHTRQQAHKEDEVVKLAQLEQSEKEEREDTLNQFRHDVFTTKLQIRSRLLGKDRFYRRYWLLREQRGILVEPAPAELFANGDDTKPHVSKKAKRNSLAAKANALREAEDISALDETWGVIKSKAQLDALTQCLNVRGEREKDLKERLEAYADILEERFSQPKPKTCYPYGIAPQVEQDPESILVEILREEIKGIEEKLSEAGMLLVAFKPHEQDWLSHVESATTPKEFVTALLELEEHVSRKAFRTPDQRTRQSGVLVFFPEQLTEDEPEAAQTEVRRARAWLQGLGLEELPFVKDKQRPNVGKDADPEHGKESGASSGADAKEEQGAAAQEGKGAMEVDQHIDTEGGDVVPPITTSAQWWRLSLQTVANISQIYYYYNLLNSAIAWGRVSRAAASARKKSKGRKGQQMEQEQEEEEEEEQEEEEEDEEEEEGDEEEEEGEQASTRFGKALKSPAARRRARGRTQRVKRRLSTVEEDEEGEEGEDSEFQESDEEEADSDEEDEEEEDEDEEEEDEDEEEEDGDEEEDERPTNRGRTRSGRVPPKVRRSSRRSTRRAGSAGDDDNDEEQEDEDLTPRPREPKPRTARRSARRRRR